MIEDVKKLAIQSCINTLNTLGMDIVQTTAEDLIHDVVNIQIQFVGGINGFVILECEQDLACKIANVLLGGMMEVTSMQDDMAKSVLSEVCNMISGNLATMISTELGITSDIKPPHIDIRPKALPSKLGTSLKYKSGDGKVLNAYFVTKS